MPDTYTIGNDQVIRAAETAAYVKAGGFSGNDLVVALAVARAESGWDYDAKGGPNSNGSYDWGLFQINDIHKPTDAEKTRPLENSRKAFAVYKAAGNKFTPWTTYKNGAYKQYLTMGKAAVEELNKRGSEFEAAALAKNGSAVKAPGELENLGPENPFDGIGKLFADSVNKVSGFFNLGLGVALGIALLVVGVVLLSRGFVSRVVAGTIKDMQKTANKAPTSAPKPVKSVEERARASLDYSAVRKRLKDADMQVAAEASRAKLRKL